MRIIGITGGVGAGKTEILSYIQKHYNCRIVRADEVAHLLEEPGHACYDRLVDLLGEKILNEDGTIHKGNMAEVIFQDKNILEQVNMIVHPAVKEYILEEIQKEKEKGEIAFFFIEAALLIEERYDLIVDEMWYIFAEQSVREQRLAQSRNYSAKKIADIIRGQLSEDEFRKHCSVVISNNGDLEETHRQIKYIMGERI